MILCPKLQYRKSEIISKNWHCILLLRSGKFLTLSGLDRLRFAAREGFSKSHSSHAESEGFFVLLVIKIIRGMGPSALHSHWRKRYYQIQESCFVGNPLEGPGQGEPDPAPMSLAYQIITSSDVFPTNRCCSYPLPNNFPTSYTPKHEI